MYRGSMIFKYKCYHVSLLDNSRDILMSCFESSTLGLSCYAQPFGYNGIAWAWDLHEIAAQINMTHRLSEFWDETHPGRCGTGTQHPSRHREARYHHHTGYINHWISNIVSGNFLTMEQEWILKICPHVEPQGAHCTLRGAYSVPKRGGHRAR